VKFRGEISDLSEAIGPSHGFVIDLFEAMELFGNVEMASKELIRLGAAPPGRGGPFSDFSSSSNQSLTRSTLTSRGSGLLQNIGKQA
jgi:hypothetical protein